MNKYNQLELLSKISSDIDIIRLTKFIHCIMEDLKHDQKNSSLIRSLLCICSACKVIRVT